MLIIIFKLIILISLAASLWHGHRHTSGPPYSGLFMGELERKAMAEWARLHPEKAEQLQRYKRMIDDGWGLWTGPLDLLFEFWAFMNSQSESINFTIQVTCLPNCERTDEHECSQVLPYLNLSMWLEEGRIETDLHRKPNLKVQYLLPTSAHPRHCFPGIAKSLALLIARICSRPQDRDKRLNELRERLLGNSCCSK